MVNQSSHRILARFRILAALLLASIAWASTVEFTHHHGLRSARAASPTEFANQTDRTSSNTRVEDSNSPQSSSRSNTGAECSLCQLQHNLATTLLSENATTATNETCTAHSQIAAKVHALEFATTLRGRAPPANL